MTSGRTAPDGPSLADGRESTRWAAGLIDSLRSGARRIVALVGEPGIGKTRLIGEIRQESGSDVALLDALCQEQGQAMPFALLRALVMSVRDKLDDAADQRRAQEILDAVGDLVGDTQPVQTIYALFEDFIRSVSTHAPVAVLVDDAHLGDEESITAISLLSRHSGLTGLLIVCSARTEAMSSDSRVISTIGRMVEGPGGEVHELERLHRGDLAALVQSELGASADDRLLDVVEKYSLGNPLFAIAAVQLLGQRSRIALRRDRAYLTDEHAGGGMTKRGALLHRLFMQDNARRTVARLVAIFGPVTLEDIPVLDDIARLPAGAVAAAFDGLIEARILEERPDGAYFFVHPLVGEMLLEDIGPLERKHLHKDLAKALARTGDPQHVRHLVMGADRGDEVAIDAALGAAADLAARRPLSAAQWYERALKIISPADTARRVQCMLGQTTAYWKGSRPARAVESGLAALRVCDDPKIRAELHSVVIGATFAMGEWPTAVRHARAAIAEFPEEPRFLAQHTASLATQGLRAELDPHLRRMRQIAEGEGERPDEVTLSFFGHVGAIVGDRVIFDYATAGLDTLMRSALARGAATGRAVAAAESLAYLYAKTGDVRACREVLATVDRDTGGSRLDLGGQRSFADGLLLAAAGRWDDALALIRRAAIDLEFMELRSNLAWLTLLEAQIEFRKGNVAAVVDLFGTSTRQAQNSRGGGIAEVLLEKARAVLEGREVDVDLIQRVCDIAHDAGWWAAELYAALTAVIAGDGTTAVDMRERIAGLRDRHPFADAEFALSLATEAGDSPPLLAAVLDGALRARSLCWLAIDGIAAHATDGIAAHARDGAVPPVGGGENDELSEDDRHMIALVRDGLNNREIAEVIHFSRKTVEARLSRLYRMFECRSRIELVVEATRQGIL
ncbi:ATP-binding protein [Cumulibacter manganitolerans]|uniref:ATP-binding protein n=1 Tax=Cumulibacter manganitolerans TaxID=1884992 RepID=UPI00188609D8|nr:LuxR family transcriptional regulator [Cumulibacter manganitolerans]